MPAKRINANERTGHLGVSLPQSLIDEVRAFAEDNGEPVSAAVRVLLIEALKNINTPRDTV